MREQNAKRTAAVKKASAKRDNILEDIRILDEKVSKVEDWKVETDLSVSKAVRSITSWKKELESLTTLYREFS